MIPWDEFGAQAPELHAAGGRLLRAEGIGYLASVKRDGSPRVHPIVPVEAGGRLFVAVNESSPKRFDLANNGRYALHAPLGGSDEEFLILGRVVRHTDVATFELVSDSAEHVIHESDWLFEFLIERCLWGYWENVGQPDTYPVRRSWCAPS